MRVELTPPRLSIQPGKPSVIAVEVTNNGTVISGHEVRLLGLDANWVKVDQNQLSLFPDQSGTFRITVSLPTGLPAGTRVLEIEVRELTPPQDVSRTRLEITVPAQPNVSISLDPMSATGGKRAELGVVVENTGNAPLEAMLTGKDDEGEVSFAFSPSSSMLQPGEQTRGGVTLRARRPWFGNPRIRAFVVQTGPAHTPALAHGAWMQRPRLSRGNLAMLGLVVAATVFAVVISATLSSVVSQSNADRDLALQVASANQNHVVGGTAMIGGTASLLSSGAPLSGVTVDLYQSGNTSPIISTATDPAGGYHFSGLAPGSYKLSFAAAGFIPLYYPEALSPSSAGVVGLSAGQHKLGVDVHLGGAPASISGQVTGNNVTGAVLTLELPPTGTSANAPGSASGATGTAGVPAVVTTQTLTSSGNFTLANIPAPAIYDVVVAESGYATATQEVDLEGGENRNAVDIALREGNGSITGTVTSPTGPIGGATISASSGTTSAQAITATTPGNVGNFILPNLPTPATLTLVVSASGYASQSVSVSLAEAQQVSGVAITLLPGVGEITGTVSTPTNTPLGGVQVSATDGSKTTLVTTTLSVGQIGSYDLVGLPVPGTYTVTFSRADLASQTQQVSLTAAAQTSAKVDISMTAQNASISGVVSDQSGSGVGEVAVSLVTGQTTYAVTTATAPTAGAYAIGGVTPGTYNLSFTRPGGVPTSVIVTLVAGQALQENETLSPAASIFGYVVSNSNTGQPVPAAQVNLYISNLYPTVIAATTTTNSSGEFVFNNVQAPQSFIVAVSYPAGSSPQETVLVTTALGAASGVCQANATGTSPTTTTLVGSSTTTTSSTSTTSTTAPTTTTSSTTTTLPSSTTCVAESDPLQVSVS